MNPYIARHYIMSKQFKFYISQLRKSHLEQSILTAKLFLHIRTSLFCLSTYFSVTNENCPYTAEELLRFIGDDYLQIIHVHGRMVSTWNKELLACISQLMAIVVACHCLDQSNRTLIRIRFPHEQVICNHVDTFIQSSYSTATSFEFSIHVQAISSSKLM
jgi:hypothetical protein